MNNHPLKSSLNLCNLQKKCIGMLDYSRVTAIAYHLMQCDQIPGDIVEFGCHAGRTAALLSGISNKRLWVYDSFEGLPAVTPRDSVNKGKLRPGVMTASILALQNTFRLAGMRLPTITAGWFKDMTMDQLPKAIAFAHLDGDLYDSIIDSLKLVYPRLSAGAVCFVDDYDHPVLKGVKSAINEFMSDKPEKVVVPRGVNGKKCMSCYFTKL